MKYKITNWDGKRGFHLQMIWKGYELSEINTYFEELKLNLKHQLK